MRCLCQQEALWQACQRVQGALLEKGLAVVGLKAHSHEKLLVQASDATMAIQAEIETTSIHLGQVFVPARIFFDLVRELPRGLVAIEKRDDTVLFTAGQNRSFSMTIPSMEGPEWVEDLRTTKVEKLAVKGVVLKYLIEQVQFCLSQDSKRNYGSVAYFHKTSKDLFRLVASDGFRLSFCEASEEHFHGNSSFLKNGFCLARRSLLEIAKLCHEAKEEVVSLCVTEEQNGVWVESLNCKMFLLLTLVNYPKYQQVIPKKHVSEVKIEHEVLMPVLKRILLAVDKTNTINVKIKDGNFELSAKNSGTAEGHEALNTASCTGPGGVLSINGRYLFDILSSRKCDIITFRFSGDEDPIIILAQDTLEGCASKHVMVPVRDHF